MFDMVSICFIVNNVSLTAVSLTDVSLADVPLNVVLFTELSLEVFLMPARES